MARFTNSSVMSTPDEPWWTHIHSGGTPEMVIIWYIICFNLMLQWYPNSTKKTPTFRRIRKKSTFSVNEEVFSIVPHPGITGITGILGFDKFLWGSRPSVCRCPLGSTCRSDAVSPSVEHETWREPGIYREKCHETWRNLGKKPEENGGFSDFSGKRIENCWEFPANPCWISGGFVV